MNSNTMPLEAETRVLIDRSLENLGWKLSGKDQNVYYEQPRSEAEKKKLCGKRPDYVLYSKDSDKPLIVIEAKKKGVRLDSALEQGIQYAKAIEAPLVFATDGVFCKAFHTVANRPPILNGEEIDEFIREALALRYLTSYEVNTVSPKVQYDRKELIRIFDEANNMLRGEGLRAGIERFGEFANILFLKLISESEQIKRESGIPTKFDVACSWDSIKQIPISTRIEYINKTVYDKLNALYDTDIFTPLQIRDASILKEIMDKLDPLMLTDVDSDEIDSIRSVKRVFKKSDILYGRLRPALNKVAYPNTDGICSTDIIVLRAKDKNSILPELYSRIFRSARFNEMVLNGVSGGQLPRVDAKYLLQLPIHKIPVTIQQKMVEELEGYQHIITGARAVVSNYTPQIICQTDTYKMLAEI